MIRIYIVEDDDVMLASLCDSFRTDAEFCVEVAVRSCAEIRAALRERAPEVLLIDLGLPDGNGVDVIAEAATRYPSLAIMVISVFGDERRVVSAIRAGAAGYLLKDDDSHEVLAAVRQLLSGGSPISPGIARHLIRVFNALSARPPATATSLLTAREQEVLSLAAKGFSYSEIAQMLSLSSHTIAWYTKQIYEKLSVTSRAEAVYEASRMGLLDQS